MKIGWIGTGVMGRSMAGHLMAAGHDVCVYTRTRERAEPLLAEGATWAGSPAEAASTADVTCLMVGCPRDVEEVVLGDDGVLSSARAGSFVIDFTTSSPELARRMAGTGRAQKVAFLDAPVSGGDVGARNATLSIMVGGERQAFDTLKPLLEYLGKTVVYQGGPGLGQHTKIVNQVVVASGMIGICEGLLLARRAGLDPETVLQSIGGGAAASWSLENYLPRILKNDLAPGFYVEHFVKDMEIALDECRRMELELPGLELAHRLYRKLADLGHSRKGIQALILALDALNDSPRAG